MWAELTVEGFVPESPYIKFVEKVVEKEISVTLKRVVSITF